MRLSEGAKMGAGCLGALAIIIAAGCGGDIAPAGTGDASRVTAANDRNADALTRCRYQKVPGVYTTIGASGTYDPRTHVFTASAGPSGQNNYAIDQFATPTPVPSMTPTPSGSVTALPEKPGDATPTPVAEYSWSGAYTVKGNKAPITFGCFFLQVSRPAPHAQFVGSSGGLPTFAPKQRYTITFLTGGHVSRLVVRDLTNAGGHGTFLLDDGATGSIELGPRQSN